MCFTKNLESKLQSCISKEAEVSFIEMQNSDFSVKIANLKNEKEKLEENLKDLESEKADFQNKVTETLAKLKRMEDEMKALQTKLTKSLIDNNKLFISKFSGIFLI